MFLDGTNQNGSRECASSKKRLFVMAGHELDFGTAAYRVSRVYDCYSKLPPLFVPAFFVFFCVLERRRAVFLASSLQVVQQVALSRLKLSFRPVKTIPREYPRESVIFHQISVSM